MRELTVLGTAGQVPTRSRNTNGYLLRWDDEVLLFDPGEGTQRQMTLVGTPASHITRILITHFHGDHCLGIAGVVQRLALDRVAHPVSIYYPASGQHYLERLLRASAYYERHHLILRPVGQEGVVGQGPTLSLRAARLDHGIETFGWRLEEPEGRRMLPERLEALGITGEAIGRLQREGSIETGGRVVPLTEVSEPRPGQSFAFIMDTRVCDAALELARGADMLVCESTYLTSEEELARGYGHLTAAQAARIAAEAGVRLLVLTHYSQRYPDHSVLLEEAQAIFPNVVAATDLARIEVPRRR
jgi:ribonuclease Z